MKIIITLMLALFLTSCSNSDEPGTLDLQLETNNACTAEDLLQVQWIKNLIGTMGCGEYACKASLFQSEYKGENVFYTIVTDPACNTSSEMTLYNCEGQISKELNSEEGRAYRDTLYMESLNGNIVQKELFFCNESE